jgi:hypothetical protein
MEVYVRLMYTADDCEFDWDDENEGILANIVSVVPTQRMS